MDVKRLYRFGKYLMEPPLRKLPYKLRYQLHWRLHPHSPWLTQESTKLIERYLKPDMQTFEWGAGRSTIFFAKRVKHHTSVENSSEWVEKVQELLRKSGLENVTLHCREEDPTIDPDEIDWPAVYPGYTYLNKPPRKPAFIGYFSMINSFEDGSLDLVLVDGRARDACLLNAIRKIKPGGMLVLDNAERDEYKEAKSCLSDWEYTSTSNHLWATDIWICPK